MRSFFKKPVWATTDSDESSSQEFYRRSHQTYNDILKVNSLQRREDAARLSALRSPAESTVPISHSKRRRISDPDDDQKVALQINNELEVSSLSSNRNSGAKLDSEIVEERNPLGNDNEDTSEDSLLAADRQESVLQSSPEVQIIDDEPSLEDESSSSILPTHDDKLPEEFVTDALAVRDKPSVDVTKGKERIQELPHADMNGEETTKTEDPKLGSADVKAETKEKEKPKEDPVLEILITSPIENTKPLIVQRLMSQRFRDVRLAWCQRQGFDKKMTSSVYLTWNKRRLFDVTTCRSLDYSALTSLSNDLELEDDIFSPEVILRIHVEAVTDEVLKSQAEKLARNTAVKDDEDVVVVDKQNSFYIVLKSQGYADLRVKVLPQTPVEQIIDNFRNKRKISLDSKISLSFDGDILDPGSQLQDYDVADMDLVDVLLR